MEEEEEEPEQPASAMINKASKETVIVLWQKASTVFRFTDWPYPASVEKSRRR